MLKPVPNWFGMPPHSVQNSVGEGISRLHVDRVACKGSTDTPERGNVLGGNDLETQEWRFCETLSDREG